LIYIASEHLIAVSSEVPSTQQAHFLTLRKKKKGTVELLQLSVRSSAPGIACYTTKWGPKWTPLVSVLALSAQVCQRAGLPGQATMDRYITIYLISVG
jgi:hypothetical protein